MPPTSQRPVLRAIAFVRLTSKTYQKMSVRVFSLIFMPPDDAVFPTEQSIKEPYESNGLFRGIRIDYEETERRTELVRQNLRELGHWNI